MSRSEFALRCFCAAVLLCRGAFEGGDYYQRPVAQVAIFLCRASVCFSIATLGCGRQPRQHGIALLAIALLHMALTDQAAFLVAWASKAACCPACQVSVHAQPAQESPTPKPNSNVRFPGFRRPQLRRSRIRIGSVDETVFP